MANMIDPFGNPFNLIELVPDGYDRIEYGKTADHTIEGKPLTTKPPSWLTENIAEASKNARSISSMYLILLAYFVLTMINTPHKDLVIKESFINLPVIDVKLPLIGFVITSAALVTFMYLYLQLYLQRLRGLIQNLKDNYSYENRSLYPWMYTIAWDAEPGFIGIIQYWFVEFFLWLIHPLGLLFIQAWSIKIQTFSVDLSLFIIQIFSCVWQIIFWKSSIRSLRQKKVSSPAKK